MVVRLRFVLILQSLNAATMPDGLGGKSNKVKAEETLIKPDNIRLDQTPATKRPAPKYGNDAAYLEGRVAAVDPDLAARIVSKSM